MQMSCSCCVDRSSHQWTVDIGFLNIIPETKARGFIIELLGPAHVCSRPCCSKKALPFVLVLGHVAVADDCS